MPFGYSAIGGLLGQMEEAKRRMQQPLAPPPDAFQLPQQGMPQGAPVAPPLAPEPPSSAFANIANANISDASDLTHGHKRGIRGLLSHALGADRVPKEIAALLTPDQVERVKPGVIGSLWNAINYGVGPQRVMQDRANNMLALQDKAANRKSAAEMARQRALIAADYATMPSDPAQRYAALTEMTGRLAAIGHPDAVKYANILNAIKPDAPKEFAPQRETWSVSNAVVDGKPTRIRTSNTGLVTDMAGNDISQRNITPWAAPIQPSFTIPSGVVGPSGKPMVLNTKTGQMEESPDANVKPSQTAGRRIAEVLPTITKAVSTLRSYTPEQIKSLSTTGVNAASIAQKESGTPVGFAFAWGANKTGLVKPQDAEYVNLIRPIADGVARASEVGILTNQDIQRYEVQVSFVAGEPDAEKEKKVQNAIDWAEWLVRNKDAIDAGQKDKITPIPTGRSGRNPWR